MVRMQWANGSSIQRDFWLDSFGSMFGTHYVGIKILIYILLFFKAHCGAQMIQGANFWSPEVGFLLCLLTWSRIGIIKKLKLQLDLAWCKESKNATKQDLVKNVRARFFEKGPCPKC